MDIFAKLIKWLEQKIAKISKKRIVNKCVCLLIPIFQSSCASASPGSQALERFQIEFSKEIAQEYGYQLIAIGASFPTDINWIDFRFSTGYSASISEGRKIIVPLAHKFIQKMNKDSDLMKYLADRPASIKNVALTLRFVDTPTSPLQSIMVIGSKNLVVYNKYNEERTMLINLHEETFDEAERIVRQ